MLAILKIELSWCLRRIILGGSEIDLPGLTTQLVAFTVSRRDICGGEIGRVCWRSLAKPPIRIPRRAEAGLLKKEPTKSRARTELLQKPETNKKWEGYEAVLGHLGAHYCVLLRFV